jgi:hypothetical protein
MSCSRCGLNTYICTAKMSLLVLESHELEYEDGSLLAANLLCSLVVDNESP